MTDHERLGRRTRRLPLVLVLLAILLAGGAASASAAETRVPLHGVQSSDAYALAGGRWESGTVPVFYNWEGGACVLDGDDFGGPATPVPQDVLLSTLQTGIAEINRHLRGGLTLQLAGPVTRSTLCSTNLTGAIVIGAGHVGTTGKTRSYTTPRQGAKYATYTNARVFITNDDPFTCTDAPRYRNLQTTVTHELLHAIGLGHSDVAGALMLPSFIACQATFNMGADDIAAVNALYPPTLPPTPTATGTPAPTPTVTPMPTATATAVPATPGRFQTAVFFSSNGQALTVFSGGTLEQLEAAAKAAGATGVWVQDGGGAFRLLVIDGPGFIRDQFRIAFPAGLPANLAVTLVR